MTDRNKIYDGSELAAFLAPALGHERADKVVSETLTRLGFPKQGLHSEEAMAVLRLISQAEGVVGVAGRFALTRVGTRTRSAPSKASQLRPMEVKAVIELFVPSVGSAKANEVVSVALKKLGIESATLSSEQVAEVLDLALRAGGIVATVARFARARLWLRASEPPKS